MGCTIKPALCLAENEIHESTKGKPVIGNTVNEFDLKAAGKGKSKSYDSRFIGSRWLGTFAMRHALERLAALGRGPWERRGRLVIGKGAA
jgi:hypothetical protein